MLITLYIFLRLYNMIQPIDCCVFCSFNRLQEEIDSAMDPSCNSPSDAHQGAAQELLEDWLLELRYKELKTYMEGRKQH